MSLTFVCIVNGKAAREFVTSVLNFMYSEYAFNT